MAEKTYRPFQKTEKEFTLVHNFLFDHIMPNVKPNAWKVLCLILRKTRGWNKLADQISFSQILKGTGISSHETVSNALKQLIEEKYIIAIKSEDQWEATTYALNENYSATISVAEDNPPTTKIVAGSTTKIVAGSTTKIVDTKETERKGNTRGADALPPPSDDDFSDLFQKREERIPDGGKTQRLTEADKNRLLVQGVFPNSPPLTDEIYQALQVVEDVWIRRISREMQIAIVFYFLAVRKTDPNLQVPCDRTTQGKWASGIKDHLDNYDLEDLKKLYSMAIRHATEQGWEIYSPHSLTSALAKVVASNAHHANGVSKKGVKGYESDPQYQFFAEIERKEREERDNGRSKA